MAINEQIVAGKFYRTLIDAASKTWQRISFWTKSTDVEFNDGMNAEAKLGEIKGITTNTNITESGYAADAKIVSQLNTSLVNLMTLFEWKELHRFTAVGESYNMSNLSYNEIEISGLIENYQVVQRISKAALETDRMVSGIVAPGLTTWNTYKMNYRIFTFSAGILKLNEMYSIQTPFPIVVRYR